MMVGSPDRLAFQSKCQFPAIYLMSLIKAFYRQSLDFTAIIIIIHQLVEPMKKEQLMCTKNLKIILLSSEKKMMQMHYRYIIEVISDFKSVKVKKTYRDFQYFAKILRDKVGIKDKGLMLNRHLRNNDDYRELEKFVHRINTGYLLLADCEDGEVNANGIVSLPAYKTKEIRSYLYVLLFEEGGLFIDGLMDESSDEESDNMRKSSDQIVESSQQKKESRERAKLKDEVEEVDLKNEEPTKKQTPKEKIELKLISLALRMRKASQPPDTSRQSKNPSLSDIFKRITSCWIKCPNKARNMGQDQIFKPYQWEEHQIVVIESSILLTNQQNIRRLIVLCNSNIELSFVEYTKLMISNDIDREPLQIRLELDKEKQDEVLYEKYLALYTVLKNNIKNKCSNPQDQNLQVFNKVRFRISLKKNQCLVNNPTQSVTYLNAKIIHGPIIASIPIAFQSFVDVDLPIVDNYGSIDIFFTEVKDASFLPSLIEPPTQSINLKMEKVYKSMYNQNRIKSKQTKSSAISKAKLIELKNTKANILIDYRPLGNNYSYCAYSEKDIYESYAPPIQFSRDEVRMHMNRLKRIMWSTETYIQFVKDLKNFTYPNLSYLFYTVLILLGIFYDHNDCLAWTFAVIAASLLYTNPNMRIYAGQAIDMLDLREKLNNLAVFMFKKNKLLPGGIDECPVKKQPKSEVSEKSKTAQKQEIDIQALEVHEYVQRKKAVFKRKFLKQFQLTQKAKRSIYKKYKRILEVLFIGQNILFEIVNVLEKTKNIFVWYYYEKTKFFFTLVILLLAVFLIVPIRFLFIGFILKTLRKSRHYHRVTQDMNRVILIQLIRITINESEMSFMKPFFKEHHRNFDYSNPETQLFFKKCSENLGNWLDITYDSEFIQKRSANMLSFVKNLSKCKTKFQIKEFICQKYGFSVEWSKQESSLEKMRSLIYGFIMTVPSDKLIMGVTTIANNDEEEEDEEGGLKQFLDF